MSAYIFHSKISVIIFLLWCCVCSLFIFIKKSFLSYLNYFYFVLFSGQVLLMSHHPYLASPTQLFVYFQYFLITRCLFDVYFERVFLHIFNQSLSLSLLYAGKTEVSSNFMMSNSSFHCCYPSSFHFLAVKLNAFKLYFHTVLRKYFSLFLVPT